MRYKKSIEAITRMLIDSEAMKDQYDRALKGYQDDVYLCRNRVSPGSVLGHISSLAGFFVAQSAGAPA